MEAVVARMNHMQDFEVQFDCQTRLHPCSPTSTKKEANGRLSTMMEGPSLLTAEASLQKDGTRSSTQFYLLFPTCEENF